MTLQAIVLIVAQCCKNSVTLAGGECDILHRQVFPLITQWPPSDSAC
jgi:hypothetical protein